MSEFKAFHPIVNFTYFALVTAFSVLFSYPVAIAVSFVCALLYSVMLRGAAAVKRNILYMLPVMLAAAAVNPLFNHEGMTILEYFPSNNPLTLESVVYGIAAAVMLAGMLLIFSNLSRVITADKLMYLFGRIIPSVSLVISMALGFVPRFTSRIRLIHESQLLTDGVPKRGIAAKLKYGARVLSIVVTWSLESAAATADSMKSRGYGDIGSRRTSYTIYRFDKRDGAVLCLILLLGAWLTYAYIQKYMYFVYFPRLNGSLGLCAALSFAAYFMLCALPLLMEIWEVLKWKAIKSKI